MEVVGIASKTKDRAERLAGHFGIPKVLGDYRALLEDPTVAVVDLCVPNALHLPLVLETIKAGKHVICEKPFAGYFGRDGDETPIGKRVPKALMYQRVL